MATSIGGCAHWEIEFGADGLPCTEGQLFLATERDRPEDLFVFCPGWNASVQSARRLSDAMFGLLAEQLPPARRAGTGFVTVLWPSLLFPEDEPAAANAGPTVSSGADLAVALASAFPDQKAELCRIGFLLDSRPRDPQRLAELHRLTSGLVTSANCPVEDDGESTVRIARTRAVLAAMATLGPPAQGGDEFDQLWSGGRELLRVLAYYEMKSRAGTVGRMGLRPLLARLAHGNSPPRVHLMGHSFGARLVSFALADLPPAPVSPVRSLLLVQAAFSHFAFAPCSPFDQCRRGALADAAERVDGPLVCTFSASDRALGRWYPNASMLARQDSEDNAAFGHRWGALGHDGFQQDDVVERVLRPAGADYDWRPRTFHRLDANQVIKHDLSRLSGSHGDILHSEIAWAAVSAAGLGH